MAQALSSIGAAPLAVRSPDLTPRCWLDAGQALLKHGGLKALKLRPLADELRVSTGSFYHHFADFAEYQAQLADYFGGPQIEDLIAAVCRAEQAPLARIRLLSSLSMRRRLTRLALAMRAWGDSNDRARLAVERHDDILLNFLTDCLVAIGFEPHEAALRGYALIAVGLGKIHAPHLRARDLQGDMLDLLCTPR